MSTGVQRFQLPTSIFRSEGDSFQIDYVQRCDSRQEARFTPSPPPSFGVAGGLAPGLPPGQWIVASAIVSNDEHHAADRLWSECLLEVLPRAKHAAIAGVDATVNDPNAKRALHARTRALGVDMESHVAARVAHDHGLPFAACRVILDPAHRTLPPAARVSLRAQAVPDPRAVLRSVTAEPSQLPGLIRLALDASIAKIALRRGRAARP